MVRILSALLLVAAPASHSPRDELLAADRAATRLSDALTPDALFLRPRSPLLRGRAAARAVADSLRHSPVFAAVSADGRFGYTWGRIERDSQPGKYLACWRRNGRAWVITAFVHNPGWADPGPVARGDSTLSPAAGGARAGREILAADSAFARLSADSGGPAAFAAYAAPDGISLPGGAPIRFGREAVRAGFADWPAGATLAWAPIWAEAAASGDVGCTVGLAEFRPREGAPSYSKYLTVWRRQEGGAWKFAADAGNSRPAPPR